MTIQKYLELNIGVRRHRGFKFSNVETYGVRLLCGIVQTVIRDARRTSLHAFTLLFTLFLFTACEHEDPFADDLVPATFSPTLAGEIDIEVDTRVVGNTWSGGEVVGISQVASGGSLATSATWYQYTASAGTSVTLTPSSSILYYPVDGSNVNFFAFSPYTAPTTANLVTYSATDQSSQAKLEAVDFIWAKATGTHNKRSPNVSLGFAHKQSKVIVKVTAGTGVSTTDIGTSAAALTLSDIPCGAQYKLSDGDLNGSITTGTITPYKNTSLTTTTSVTWEAIVPPHAGTSYTSRKMNFTFNGKSYSYTMPTADTYLAGYSYTYDLTLTTSGVVLQSTTVSNWTGGATSWNGGTYVLHTTSSDLTFSPGTYSQTLQIQYKGTTTAPVAVTSTSATNSTAGTVSWLTASVAGSTTTSNPWTQRTLTVTATENTGTTNRTGYIHVSLEGLSVVITVMQLSRSTITLADGNTNCFMVAPGATIHFPVTRAIDVGGAPSTATFTVSRVWDDTSGCAVASYSISGTGSDAVISVTASSNPGNALIGVSYWSWHIWVTDYKPWQGATFTNTWNTNNYGKNFVFMDRNLGAINAGRATNEYDEGRTHGLYYQWGRKDPFPSTGSPGTAQPGDGLFMAMSVPAGTFNILTSSSFMFFLNTSDWYDNVTNGNTRDDTLWGHGNTTAKSVYDPCPTGWRVPSYNVGASDFPSAADSPWSGFTIARGTWSGGGYSWGTNALWPTSGYRLGSTGELNMINVYGYFWSASPRTSESKNAMAFFITVMMSSEIDLPRAYGLPVRCVRE